MSEDTETSKVVDQTLYKTECLKMLAFCMVKGNGVLENAFKYANLLLHDTKTENDNCVKLTDDEIRKEHYKNAQIYFVIKNRIGRIVRGELNYEGCDIDLVIVRGLKDYSFETFKKRLVSDPPKLNDNDLKLLINAINSCQILVDKYIKKDDDDE